MKAYELKKRLRKTHGKAKFVGFLYLLGSIALTAIACLPIFAINGTWLWAGNFWWYIKEIFKAPRDWFSFGVAALYAIMLLAVAINCLRCFGKLGSLWAKKSKQAKGYNRNLCAMDEMGKLFSDSFSAIVGIHFLIYIVEPVGAVRITYVAYAMAAVGILLHFFCGLIGAKTSVFNVDKATGAVEEEKRPCKLFVYFFRNLVQIAAVAAIVWFFVRNCNFNDVVVGALAKNNPFRGGVMKVAVPLALELAMVVWVLVLIKHATNVTEFNRFGIDGDGMKNFRVFSLFVALTSGGWYVIQRFFNKTSPSWAFAIIAGVAFAAFLIDCIFKSRPKENVVKVEEGEAEQTPQAPQYPYMQPMVMPMQPAQAPAPVQIYQQPAQTQYQPIYIPIYCPYPGYAPAAPVAQQAPQPQSAPAVSGTPIESVEATYARPIHNVMPPMPAPEYLRPTPSPYAMAAEQQEAMKAAQAAQTAQAPAPAQAFAPAPAPVVEEDKEDEAVNELDPRKEWKVRCPRCGKELMVRETTPYHRCPACDKVFKLQRFRTYTKKTEE